MAAPKKTTETTKTTTVKKKLSKNPKKRTPLTTVRQRKLRRKAEAATEAEQKAKDEIATSSEHWEGGRKDQLLLRKALRWQTEMTSEQVEAALRSGDASLKDLAMAIIRKGMLFRSEGRAIDEARVNQLAVNNLLRAEQQNQADEHKEKPSEVIIHGASAITPEQQRAAIVRAIVAERDKRPVGPATRRRRSSVGNGKPRPKGIKS